MLHTNRRSNLLRPKYSVQYATFLSPVYGRPTRHGGRTPIEDQWKKWRVPVKYSVTPAASAACDHLARPGPNRRAARPPSPRRRSGSARPSANGKNASEAATEPAARGHRPRDDREPRGVDPVDLTHADADARAVRRRAGSRWTSPTGTPSRRTPGRRGPRRRPRTRRSQLPGRPGRRPGASTRSARLHQQAAVDPAGLRQVAPAPRADQQPDVLLPREHLDSASS